jgi:transposase
MTYRKQSVAILVSHDELHLRHSYLTEDNQVEIKKSRKLPNTPREHWEAHAWIENQMAKHPEVPLVVVLEAAGMYHQAIINFLYEKGYSLYVILPAKPGEGTPVPVPRSKAGNLDMGTLSQIGLNGKLLKWELPGFGMKKLRLLSRELIQRKKDLMKINKQLKIREGSKQPAETTIARLKAFSALMEKQVAEINQEIGKLMESDRELSKPIDHFAKTRGLDRITLATLISETDGYYPN